MLQSVLFFLFVFIQTKILTLFLYKYDLYVYILACPFLSAPMYGDLSLSGFSVGDTAIVTCDTGYVLNGSTVRYCTPSGWDGIEADCVPVRK